MSDNVRVEERGETSGTRNLSNVCNTFSVRTTITSTTTSFHAPKNSIYRLSTASHTHTHTAASPDKCIKIYLSWAQMTTTVYLFYDVRHQMIFAQRLTDDPSYIHPSNRFPTLFVRSALAVFHHFFVVHLVTPLPPHSCACVCAVCVCVCVLIAYTFLPFSSIHPIFTLCMSKRIHHNFSFNFNSTHTRMSTVYTLRTKIWK